MATDAERRQALESRIALELTSGGVLESQTAYTAVVIHGKKTNHILHLILSVITAGLWLIVWAVLILTRKQQRVVLSVDDEGVVNRSLAAA
jgi:hypothetical protein